MIDSRDPWKFQKVASRKSVQTNYISMERERIEYPYILDIAWPAKSDMHIICAVLQCLSFGTKSVGKLDNHHIPVNLTLSPDFYCYFHELNKMSSELWQVFQRLISKNTTLWHHKKTSNYIICGSFDNIKNVYLPSLTYKKGQFQSREEMLIFSNPH